ncbi:hypothetical protein AVEN_252860-2 [Araneus ventricosus]|nr:hypothetical protein AVEN_252860-2 [Araneus ventricosus]
MNPVNCLEGSLLTVIPTRDSHDNACIKDAASAGSRTRSTLLAEGSYANRYTTPTRARCVSTFPLYSNGKSDERRENRALQAKKGVKPLAQEHSDRNTPNSSHDNACKKIAASAGSRTRVSTSGRQLCYRYTTDATECVTLFRYSNGKSD